MTFDLRTFVELAVTSMEGASNVPYQATFAAMGIDKRTKKMIACSIRFTKRVRTE